MKFNLFRPLFSPEMDAICRREIRRQKIKLFRATKKEMKELLKIEKLLKTGSLPSYLVRKKLPFNLGYGIFLHPNAKPIEKGTLIASYAGQLSIIKQNEPYESGYVFEPIEKMLLTKEEQHVFDEKNKYHPKRLYALKLDALKKGNFTRFINHCEKPNIIAHLVSVPKNSLGLSPSPIEVMYFAKKIIRPGEQLLVCYEEEEGSYWKPANITPFPMTPRTFRLTPTLKLHYDNTL